MPIWIGVVVALSLAAIAIAFGVMAWTLARVARQVADRSDRLVEEMTALRGELHPTLTALAGFTTEGRDLTRTVRQEVDALVGTSRRLRTGVDRGAQAIQHRLRDLEALYEILHEEIEDTALATAATLRAARTGAGWIGRLGRLVGLGRTAGRRLRRRMRKRARPSPEPDGPRRVRSAGEV